MSAEPENYREFFESLQIKHFSYREVVNVWAGHRKMKPPKRFWYNIIPTIRAGDNLREDWGRPLRIVAAYRPWGGAKNSQHRKNRAIDYDLVGDDRTDPDCVENFRDLCATHLSMYGKSLKMGMGFYKSAPYRVHIDTGYRLRDWWGDSVFDRIERLGLKDPRK